MRALRLSLTLALVLVLGAGAAAAEEVTFTYAPGGAVQSVSVRGSFNGWGETPMTEGDDAVWSVTLALEAGEHQYKYFVNGQWPSDMATALNGGPADPDADGYADDGYGGQNAIRVVGGEVAVRATAPAPPLADGHARVHYHRPHADYAGWGLHVWEDTAESVEWTSPLAPAGETEYGLYWDVRLLDDAAKLGFLIHKGDAKDPGPDMFLDLTAGPREVWLLSGRTTLHAEPPDVSTLALGDLSLRRAHWVDRGTVAWRIRVGEGETVRLHATLGDGLRLTPEGVVGDDMESGGWRAILAPAPEGLSSEARAKFPHLTGHAVFRVPEQALDLIPAMLKGQVAVSITDAEGKLRDATGLQIPGVLDDLFAYDGPLGVTWEDGAPTLRLWAPTAVTVRVHLFHKGDASAPSLVLSMVEQAGVWVLAGEPAWKNAYYLYEILVYSPEAMREVVNLVTDPYSHGLNLNSERSMLVDLEDPALMPDGWSTLAKPPLAAPEDIVLYELHVRDFSAADETVPADLRGTYLAFTADSDGTRHLRSLAEAGLTHLHLLPVFDIASVNEDRATWAEPGDLTGYAPDGEEQQAAVAAVQQADGYNWGYDPFHYGTPEGSYATEPEGPQRILEFRRMVQSLSELGLRVVMDVVYNHTHASGQADKSVLDQVVPGYYHRLNADGFVETSTCCRNTATEHAMMERLMVDDLVHWARDYKVDGFRFDLMGHHMKRNMERARDALRALTPAADGVDGSAIYLYGEGWDFGEVGQGARGVNATQLNLPGTGIGTFNDRFRDAARGGSPFTDRREQGFVTGLYVAPNGFNGGGPAERSRLLTDTDRLRAGLAGNVRDYRFVTASGAEQASGAIDRGGYATDPEETINYISAHDNETLYDKIQFASAPPVALADRVRMQQLGISVTALAQGVPFFHAGVDLLRSKSLDADSYNSGDWFNRLDFSSASNNFGVGLPIAEKNRDRWAMMRPILIRSELKPGRAEIEATAAHFRTMLAVRRSSPLFRLRTAADIQARVRFHNTGPDQMPGLVVMELRDEPDGGADLDPAVRGIVVLFNAAPQPLTFAGEPWRGRALALHPLQAGLAGAAYDAERGAFTVPPRTTAVFVEPQDD